MSQRDLETTPDKWSEGGLNPRASLGVYGQTETCSRNSLSEVVPCFVLFFFYPVSMSDHEHVIKKS